MTALAVIEFLVVIALAYAAITQVFVPLTRGTIMFPWFRAVESHLVHERSRLMQKKTEKGLQAEIDKLRSEVNDKEKGA